MRRRDETQREIGEYIRGRLRDECQVRGTAARIARATKFTTSWIAQAQQPGTSIGESFARAMADYWGVPYSELEALARDEARRRGVAPPRSPPVAYRRLGELPGWAEALAVAKDRYRSIPADIWQRVQYAVLPDIAEPTPEDIGRTAQILYDHSPGQPGHDRDVTGVHRRILREHPPESSQSPRPGTRPPPGKKNSQR